MTVIIVIQLSDEDGNLYFKMTVTFFDIIKLIMSFYLAAPKYICYFFCKATSDTNDIINHYQIFEMLLFPPYCHVNNLAYPKNIRHFGRMVFIFFLS